jgi:hypothetical protein
MAYALIGAGALARAVSFYFSDNAGGDAGAHALLAAEWLKHPDLRLVFDTYPPGHFWLIGLFSLIVHSVVLAGRMLSLFLGIASVYVVWRIARLLYTPVAAFFSLAAFALYSLHIGYSTTSSAEVAYLFFLLAGIYLFLAGVNCESGRLRLLLLSGICFSVSESIRFEAWIFSAALFAAAVGFALADRHQAGSEFALTDWFALASTMGAWPIFMAAYSWRDFGDPLHLVTMNSIRVGHSVGEISLFHRLAVMPVATLLSVSPVVILASVIGIAVSLSSARSRIFAAATLFFAAVQSFEVLHGGLLATARYTITIGTLLCVISGCGFECFIQRFRLHSLNFPRITVIALLLFNCGALLTISMRSGSMADEIASVSPRLRYQSHLALVARYLRAHVGPGDDVVFDNYMVESNILAEAAGLPVPPGDRAYMASKKNKVPLAEYISSVHPRFLVYSDRGTLRQSLNLPGTCNGSVEIGSIELRCMFEDDVYRVYELSYSPKIPDSTNR